MIWLTNHCFTCFPILLSAFVSYAVVIGVVDALVSSSLIQNTFGDKKENVVKTFSFDEATSLIGITRHQHIDNSKSTFISKFIIFESVLHNKKHKSK